MTRFLNRKPEKRLQDEDSVLCLFADPYSVYRVYFFGLPFAVECKPLLEGVAIISATICPSHAGLRATRIANGRRKPHVGLALVVPLLILVRRIPGRDRQGGPPRCRG